MESKLLAQMDIHDGMKELQQELTDKINELEAQLEAKKQAEIEEAVKRKPLTRTGSSRSCKRYSTKDERQIIALKYI